MPPLRRIGVSSSGGPSDRRSAGSVPFRPFLGTATLVLGVGALLAGAAGCQPPTGTGDELRAPRHVIPRARSVTPTDAGELDGDDTFGAAAGSRGPKGAERPGA